ncbi:MAG: hypothetical protein R3C32_14940 [Chloroflexota bacterium]
MFDVVGRRKWFYAISLAVTIPGLLFILLTLLPGARLGLQFSIAYRGGTEWTIHFAEGAPEPQDVVQVLADNGLTGSEVVTTSKDGRDYTLIRTSAVALATHEGDASAGAQGSRRARARRRRDRHRGPQHRPHRGPSSMAPRWPRPCGLFQAVLVAQCRHGRQDDDHRHGQARRGQADLEAVFGPIDESWS